MRLEAEVRCQAKLSMQKRHPAKCRPGVPWGEVVVIAEAAAAVFAFTMKELRAQENCDDHSVCLVATRSTGSDTSRGYHGSYVRIEAFPKVSRTIQP